MDFGFLASANSITSKYLSQNITEKSVSQINGIDEDTKKKFGEAFEAAYDSLAATKTLSESMRAGYDATHQDSLKEHQSRLGYSIDNRVIDMLHLQLSDDMNNKVSAAMDNALEELGNLGT